MSILEIIDINDDLLLPWLDLYEVSFPPEEKVLISKHLQTIKQKANGQAADKYFLAAVESSGRLDACIYYELCREHSVLHLQYLAVIPEMQCKGIGNICYNNICDRARESGMSSIMLEVEIPGDTNLLAKRRIDFYRRHGAFLLTGINYMQTVGPHQKPIPMQIMVHPFYKISAEDAFGSAKSVFGSSITKAGRLALE